MENCLEHVLDGSLVDQIHLAQVRRNDCARPLCSQAIAPYIPKVILRVGLFEHKSRPASALIDAALDKCMGHGPVQFCATVILSSSTLRYQLDLRNTTQRAQAIHFQKDENSLYHGHFHFQFQNIFLLLLLEVARSRTDKGRPMKACRQNVRKSACCRGSEEAIGLQ